MYDNLQSELEGYQFGCFTGEKPMSGFFALLLATTMCETIDMYGFEPWEHYRYEREQLKWPVPCSDK